MSFRRNPQGQVAEARREHMEWRRRNADLIEQTGLPEFCFTIENWDELLEYGSLRLESINIDDLTIRQQAALLRLMAMTPNDITRDATKHLIIAMIETVERIYP